tara:strand:- start:519 stop:968 length:450 start_codon:yes stop_codon:yes gene_type:complete
VSRGKTPNKNFKRNKNSWLGSASLHILTNYFCPLKWALVFLEFILSPFIKKDSLMLNKLIILICTLIFTGCVVVPEVDHSQKYQCGLSTDKKTLKVVNLLKNDTSFYEWNDEFLSIITMPTSAVVSSVYVAVNNVYHFGEKQIKCGNKN